MSPPMDRWQKTIRMMHTLSKFNCISCADTEVFTRLKKTVGGCVAFQKSRNYVAIIQSESGVCARKWMHLFAAKRLLIFHGLRRCPLETTNGTHKFDEIRSIVAGPWHDRAKLMRCLEYNRWSRDFHPTDKQHIKLTPYLPSSLEVTAVSGKLREN